MPKKRSAPAGKKPTIPLEVQSVVVLENWKPTIPKLVQNVQTTLSQLRPLEEEASTIQLKVQNHREAYLNELLMRYERQQSGKELTLEEKVKAQSNLDQLQEMSEEISEVGREKIQLATQAYDLIDAEIQRLDDAVKKIESEYPTETAVLRDVSAHREHAKRIALRKAMPTTPGGSALSSSALTMASPGDVKYCVCQAPAHGKMISCDNETCLIEWFHLSCVGLKEPPKVGKWYCPECFDLLGDTNKPRRKRKRS
jgi:inhibitor of growth protein 4